jgi:hypothetical protein
MKHIITIDFETFYDTGYGLKNILLKNILGHPSSK